jgi:thymidylate synthase
VRPAVRRWSIALTGCGINPNVGREAHAEKTMTQEKTACYFVDMNGLPDRFPTHKHEAVFWESLGRAVATFGFLEEIIAKAIFSFTGTRPYNEDEVQQAYTEWIPKLNHALFDPLGNLIETYGKAVKDHPDAAIDKFDDLLDDLRNAAQMRNILCHGSWRVANEDGASIPFFVNRKMEVVDSAMDRESIDQVQRHAAHLVCAVINSVTQMGWQFPGSAGPGKSIYKPTAQPFASTDSVKSAPPLGSNTSLGQE